MRRFAAVHLDRASANLFREGNRQLIKMSRTLIIGYGNPDRQDDGVAYHILIMLAQHLGLPAPSSPEELFLPSDGPVELQFALQLYPELAEELGKFNRVCFVDAHTGSIPDDLNLEELQPDFQRSPLTHHMTPATCLALCQVLYGKAPEAILVSVRGYAFGFERSLSPATSSLSDQAAGAILGWLQGPMQNSAIIG